MKIAIRLALAIAGLGWLEPADAGPRGQRPLVPAETSPRPVACTLSGDGDRIIADCSAEIASGKPGLDAAYFARANAYAIRGNVDQALADYTAALALRPSIRAYNNRALMYEARGDTARAVADFDLALRLEPDDPASLLSRGRIFARQGRRDKALADFDRAIAVAPRFPFAYLARGNIRFQEGDLERARADVAKYRALMPNDPEGAKAEAGLRAASGPQKP